jgi:molecular chaperone HscB
VRPPTSTPAPPPQTKTHYDLFPLTLPAGPPPNGPFSIDTRALRAEFRQIQAKIHPDTQPAHLRPGAEVESSQLNEAFRTLADPLHRAQYLLRLRGIDLAGDEAARVDDAEMLMQVMDAREAIEDAAEEEDLEETRVENEKRIEACVRALGEAFESKEVDFKRAKREAVRLKYWTNIAEALQNWEKGKSSVLMH